MDDITCSLDGCERTDLRPSGYCDPHHRRWIRRGDPGDPRVQAPRGSSARATECSIDGCGRPGRWRGLCQKHSYRFHANGNPLTVRPPGPSAGETHPSWKGDAISYDGAHKRVTRHRGRADAHHCTSCDGPAREWAYVHGSSAEQIDPKTDKPFSADVDDYMPMCAPCHRRYDNGGLVDRWLEA